MNQQRIWGITFSEETTQKGKACYEDEVINQNYRLEKNS
jgi:hypothetical protein